MKRTFLVLIVTVLAILSRVSIAADTNATTVRIGVYDSRAVAYAWFWSDAERLKRKTLFEAVTSAQKDGDEKKRVELQKAMENVQADSHRKVFSTAPVDDVLALVKGPVDELKTKANVSLLVSRWNEAALKKYPNAEKIDVTDPLVKLFLPQPTEKQLKTIEQIRQSTPLPLEKANELIREGKL